AEPNHAVESARGERSGETDRDAPGLDGLGLAPDLLEADRLGVEVRRALAPERATRGDRVVQELAATAVVELYGVELLLLPTGPHAQLEPPSGQHVEDRSGLGEERRRAQRRDEDPGCQPYSSGRARDRREHGERIQPRCVDRQWEGPQR